MKTSKNINLNFIYIFTDFVIGFIGVLISILSCSGFGIFSDTLTMVTSLVFSGSVALLIVLSFTIAKVYGMIIKNLGLFESFKLAIIALSVLVVSFIAAIFIPRMPGIKGEYILSWLLSTVSICFLLPSTRVIPRFVRSLKIINAKRRKSIRTLIIGAGSAAKILIDDSRNNILNNNKIVALIDDDPTKIGSSLASLPIAGPISNIKNIISEYRVEEVIIAIASLSNNRLHEIVSELESSPVRIKRMPLLTEMNGPNDIKIINIDLDELLCRPTIILDNSEVNNMLSNKRVMVTGAGGSIGSELIRQIYKTHPKTLILFDIYENSTYDIQQELRRKMREDGINDIELVTLIGSTYNLERIEYVIKTYKPEYIYHAAAYKHVPLMEDSPAEAIRTNVIGTYNVAKLADKYKVKKMVLVSTDKAVRPTNVMGATKRFAETIIQYFSSKSKNTTYAAVRFGNVLGSNGSVVPLFKKQIEAGGPVTLTHKDIIRYFMTIPEAVSLILQCGLFAEGGEIFILDMGKPVKIINLAEKLIRQAGLVPYKDIDIIETGLRPGEKLFEELLLDPTTQKKTPNKRIFIEEAEPVKPIEEEIIEISKVFSLDNVEEVKDMLASIITTYTKTK